MPLLEVACFTPESAIIASKAGADRIELCQNRDAGGITPSLDTFGYVKQHAAIPVFVMIRTRGGDFNFSTSEFAAMERDILTFKQQGADGFVLGVLTEDHEIDVPRTKSLVYCGSPLPCTFHRAFDEVRDKAQALEEVIATGCRAVLSSGGAHTALAGSSVLRGLVEQSANRIDVIAGGGVRAKHVLELSELATTNAFHSSGILAGEEEADSNEVCEMKRLISGISGPALSATDRFQQRQPPILSETAEQITDSLDDIVPAVSVGTNTPVDENNKRLQ